MSPLVEAYLSWSVPQLHLLLIACLFVVMARRGPFRLRRSGRRPFDGSWESYRRHFLPPSLPNRPQAMVAFFSKTSRGLAEDIVGVLQQGGVETQFLVGEQRFDTNNEAAVLDGVKGTVEGCALLVVLGDPFAMSDMWVPIEYASALNHADVVLVAYPGGIWPGDVVAGPVVRATRILGSADVYLVRAESLHPEGLSFLGERASRLSSPRERLRYDRLVYAVAAAGFAVASLAYTLHNRAVPPIPWVLSGAALLALVSLTRGLLRDRMDAPVRRAELVLRRTLVEPVILRSTCVALIMGVLLFAVERWLSTSRLWTTQVAFWGSLAGWFLLPFLWDTLLTGVRIHAVRRAAHRALAELAASTGKTGIQARTEDQA